jgi:hypothetical protein
MRMRRYAEGRANMKKLLLAAVGLAVSLVIAAAASGKELKEVKICGPADCRVLTEPDATEAVAQGGQQTFRPSAPGPYYSVTYTVDEGDATNSWQVFYVPSSRKLEGEGEFGGPVWTALSKQAAAALQGATAGLASFPKPVLTEVRVGSKRVSVGQASHLDLYRIGNPYTGPQGVASGLRITLQSAVPSPWTGGSERLIYRPSHRLLYRDGQVVRLSKPVASRLMRRVALG